MATRKVLADLARAAGLRRVPTGATATKKLWASVMVPDMLVKRVERARENRQRAFLDSLAQLHASQTIPRELLRDTARQLDATVDMVDALGENGGQVGVALWLVQANQQQQQQEQQGEQKLELSDELRSTLLKHLSRLGTGKEMEELTMRLFEQIEQPQREDLESLIIAKARNVEVGAVLRRLFDLCGRGAVPSKECYVAVLEMCVNNSLDADLVEFVVSAMLRQGYDIPAHLRVVLDETKQQQ